MTENFSLWLRKNKVFTQIGTNKNFIAPTIID